MEKVRNWCLMMKKGGIKVLIIAVVLACMLVGYYFYLNNKSSDIKEDKAISAVENAMLRNLDRDYPPSPKEVVKYYAEITKCFYEGGYSDEQLSELAKKSRELFDDELKQEQTEEEYLRSLKFDIDGYKDKNIVISSFSTSTSVDVDYWNEENRDYARLYCMYNIRQGSVMTGSNHEFILRKDDEGHWKILGFKLASDNE